MKNKWWKEIRKGMVSGDRAADDPKGRPALPVSVPGLAVALIVLLFMFLVCLVPINPHDEGFWLALIFALAAYGLVNFADQSYKNRKHGISSETVRSGLIPFAAAGILLILMILSEIAGSTVFHAKAYSQILQVQEADFQTDLAESLGTDSIALMDTASAQMLGNREIGSLSSVVSQFEVSEDYTQIDEQGKPLKVAPLEYAGFLKWLNNREEGVPGYVSVDPVSMSADYKQCEEGMIYVPSAYFLEDAGRHIRLAYPTAMFGNLHFETDEEGDPWYVASVYQNTIFLFGGTTVTGCILLNPVTGEMQEYELADVPAWIDVVYDGDTICTQYNWNGTLSGGFLNSIFSKKGCRQITEYTQDEEKDEVPTADYGYVSKDGDIWIYTGVTSLNNDSSNIGFLLANERTGESHYYTIAGADEKSAMAAAEGEVQEKGYQASFPSLINVDGDPTYIMVLKDNSGLVKLYAAVNVEQYNLVTTASTQAECLNRYRQLLGGGSVSDLTDSAADTEETLSVEEMKTIQIAGIRFIDIDGNTWIYLITSEEEIYKAKAKDHEDMLLLQEGDSAMVGVNGNVIVEYQRAEQ